MTVDRPAEFEGILTLRMASLHPGEPTPGWRAAFGTPDGQPVPTVSKAVIHVEPERPVWAELTMFAGADGRPLLAARPGDPAFDPDRERVFRYLIEFIPVRADVAAQRP